MNTSYPDMFPINIILAIAHAVLTHMNCIKSSDLVDNFPGSPAFFTSRAGGFQKQSRRPNIGRLWLAHLSGGEIARAREAGKRGAVAARRRTTRSRPNSNAKWSELTRELCLSPPLIQSTRRICVAVQAAGSHSPDMQAASGQQAGLRQGGKLLRPCSHFDGNREHGPEKRPWDGKARCNYTPGNSAMSGPNASEFPRDGGRSPMTANPCLGLTPAGNRH